MDHDIKADTQITFSLNIGFVGDREETQSAEDWIGCDPEDLSLSELEGLMEDALREWRYNYIDTGWAVRD